MRNYSFFLFAFILLLPFWGSAQSSKPNFLISPEGDTVKIKVISDADITKNVEETYSKIKRIEATLVPESSLTKFDSIYRNAHKKLDSLKTIILSKEEYNSVSEIDNTLQEWNTYSLDLEKWSGKINDRIKILQDDFFEVSVSIETWNVTIEKSKSSGVPGEVLSSVEELLRTLHVLSRTIKDNQNETLSKQNRITSLRLTVDEVNTFLSEKRKSIQADYLIQDSPLIWNPEKASGNVKQIKDQFKQSLLDNQNSISLFYATNKNKLIFQLFLFIFLWIGFYYLHRQSINENEYDNKSNLEASKDVISEHTLSALVITLFVSIWLYPVHVSVISHITQLLFIFIALFFLPGYIEKRLRPILLTLLLLFFVNYLLVLVSGKFLFTRLILLLTNGINFWILYRIVSPKYFIAKKLNEHNWGIILKLIRLFYVVVAVSVLANIFGYVKLAILLNNASVNILFDLNILLLVIMVLRHTITIFVRTPVIQSSNIIRQNYQLIEKRTLVFIQVVGVLLWIRAILKNLGIFDSINVWLSQVLEANWKIGESTISVQGIVNFILVIIVTLIFNRIIKTLLKDELYPRVKLPRGVPGAISMITGYIIAGYGVFIALGSAGVDLKSFGLIAGALGVGIGFGLQGIVANFIAGLVIAFERPIQVGDTIEMGNMMGDVTKIGVRACTVKTFDGSEVIIPNSSLITNDVTNWTLSDRRKRRDINIGVAYGSDPHQVLELIKEVANNHPDVLKIPAPWALFDGFGDNSLNFRVRIWTTMDNGMSTKSSVAVNIYDALQDAGIEIPFPQRDLHLRSIDPNIRGLENLKEKPIRKKKPTSRKPAKKNDSEGNFEDDIDNSNDNTN